MSREWLGSVEFANLREFQDQVWEFIHTDISFTTTLVVGGEISQGWNSFETAQEYNHSHAVLLRKPLDDSADQAMYVLVFVSHLNIEVDTRQMVVTLNDEEYRGPHDLIRFVQRFAQQSA